MAADAAMASRVVAALEWNAGSVVVGLLRSALHALATRVAILIIFIHHTVGVTKDSGLSLVVEILEAGGLRHGIGRRNVLDRGRGENLAEGLEDLGVLGPVLLGELDVKSDIHVAEVVVPGRRHTLATNHLDSIWKGQLGTHLGHVRDWVRTLSNGLTRENINGEPPVVEVLDVDGTTGKGSDELDVANIEQVVFPTGEAGVRLLLNLENDIASLDTRRLVTLTSELDLGAASNTLVDVDVEDLAVDGSLLSVALFASVLLLDDLTLSVAVGADSLESLDHRTHLAHHGLHAVTITARAALDSALLATKTLALGADDGPLKSELRDLAAVDVLEGDLVSVVDGSGLGRATVHAAASKHAAKTSSKAASAEELGKQVLGGHATTAGTALEAGLAILIIDLALL